VTISRYIKRTWLLAPIFGILGFMGLYYLATLYYPGGSQFNENSVGFSWTDNYWCNLLNDDAINGEKNAAKPIALTAMIILCSSLTLFWWKFPQYTMLDGRYKLSIRFSGTLAMCIGFLLLTEFDHDLIINLAVIFGLIATAGTFIGLYKNGWRFLFVFGLFNVLLIIANNVLYHSSTLIAYLPVVQKLTFASFLIWVCGIDIRIYSSTQRVNVTGAS
jgi:hypothetical protein